MSAPRQDVDEVDRLARVKLSCTIEPGDLRVIGLVSETAAQNEADWATELPYSG